MSWSGGYATISMGGTPINLTNSTKASQMATPSIGTRMISFNSDLIAEIDRKAKFNGRLKYPNGDEFNLKDMQIRNLNTPFDYSFDVGSISIKAVRKTKSKQPRFIQVWREL